MLCQSCCQPHNEPGAIYIKNSVQNEEGEGVLVRKYSKS